MLKPMIATKRAWIKICHGQNCRDVGGLSLSEQCEQLGIPFQRINCQSLCSYAPTAKVNDVAILRANLDDILPQNPSHAHGSE